MTAPDLSRLAGLFVGQLTPEEYEAFNAACRRGEAHRRYTSTAGFLRLAKVGLGPHPGKIERTAAQEDRRA